MSWGLLLSTPPYKTPPPSSVSASPRGAAVPNLGRQRAPSERDDTAVTRVEMMTPHPLPKFLTPLHCHTMSFVPFTCRFAPPGQPQHRVSV